MPQDSRSRVNHLRAQLAKVRRRLAGLKAATSDAKTDERRLKRALRRAERECVSRGTKRR